jgi:Cu2+-exporting ATPase
MIAIIALVSISIHIYRKKQFNKTKKSKQPKSRENTNNSIIASSLKDKSKMSIIDRDLRISTVSLMLAITGTLIYKPLLILSAPGLLWISIVNYRDAVVAYKKGRKISIYTLSTLFSAGALITGSYFAGNLGAFSVRLSKKMLSSTEDDSTQQLINVFGHQPHFAWLLKDNVELNVPVDSLVVGDIVVVNAGETIPIDGTVVSGSASIDECALTGESQPSLKDTNHEVLASTMVLSGKLNVKVTKAGEDTLASQIGEILNKTKDYKNDVLSWGEGVADRSAYISICLSILFLPVFGLTSALTVLNASFGIYMMALGPLSMLNFIKLSGKAGILLKDGRSLQLLNSIDTIVFDKTGTLTEEIPHVGKIHTTDHLSTEQLLVIAATLEIRQTHPIALAIQETVAKIPNIVLPETEVLCVEIGYGIQANLANNPTLGLLADDNTVLVGSKRFMERENIVIPTEMQLIEESVKKQAYSLVYVGINKQLVGIIELHTTIRAEAYETVRKLQERNMEVIILSGDQEIPTREIAKKLGIKNYIAETLPEGKAELITQLQTQGKSVCFVGDGINDTIALKKANVSVSMSQASQAATDSAQIILMNQNLMQLLEAFDIAEQYTSNMKLNTKITTLPGFVIVFGTLFFHFGMVHSVILNGSSLVIGASNSMKLSHQKKAIKPP